MCIYPISSPRLWVAENQILFISAFPPGSQTKSVPHKCLLNEKWITWIRTTYQRNSGTSGIWLCLKQGERTLLGTFFVVLMQDDFRLRVYRVSGVEERWEKNPRFPLLQNMLKEFIEHITWIEKGKKNREMGVFCSTTICWALTLRLALS